MRDVHARACMVFLFCVSAVVGLLSLTAVAIDPPKPEWGTNDCHGSFTQCANVTTKESWLEDGKSIYFFLDAIVGGEGGKWGNTTVWYVGEKFDVAWAEDLQTQSFNVVRFSPRGSELAYPHVTCSPDYYSSDHGCQPNVSCADEIARSGLNMAHYSIAETAADLAWVLQTLGAGMKNVVVAEGLGTFVVERMLKNFDKLQNISVIMAGYTHPEYFDIFESIGNYDAVLQRVLSLCEQDASVACISRTGAFEGLWNRFVNVMEAAKAGTLECNSQLNWGVNPEAMHDEYRAILAALLKTPQHFLLPSQTALVQLIPSFIYRLQRCEKEDQLALTHLHSYLKLGRRSRCPSFIPQRYNWLVNEFTLSKSPVTPEELISRLAVDRQVLPNISVLQKFYDFYEAHPKYNVTDKAISKTDVKMLLLPSDMDPVFSFGAATLAVAVYGATVRFLPHQTGFPVASTASECITHNLLHLRAHDSWDVADRCKLSSRYDLDFINFDARDYYNVADAWEFTKPNMPEPLPDSPTTFPTDAPSGPDDDNTGGSRGAVAVLAVFLALTLLTVLGGGLYVYWTKTRHGGLSGDLYANLSY